jgi:ABC-type antimicrobial peptide transport system permease subunit
VDPIHRAIEGVDRTLPIFVNPVNDLVRGTVSQDVLLVQVTMFFCIVTLVLAALGLYGVTAYSASQRTSEFGLRAALGAEPGDVTRMVLGEAVRVAMIGVVIGVPAGLAATRLMSRDRLASERSTSIAQHRDRRVGGGGLVASCCRREGGESGVEALRLE